jgi:hypothetical protein
MGDLIRFPMQDGEADGDWTWKATPDKCAGVMHVFQAVPGPCECGEEFWGPNGLEDADSDVIGIHHVA